MKSNQYKSDPGQLDRVEYSFLLLGLVKVVLLKTVQHGLP